MFEIIDNLRQKPDRSKKRIAFLVSFSFCLIIFVVWLTVIYPDFKRRQERKTASSISTSTPIDTFTSIFSEGFSKVGSQINEAKKTIQEVVSSSTPYYYKATSTTENIEVNSEGNTDKIE